MTLIHTTDDLEELLSRPSEADVEAARNLAGDLLILGAAGKMGPSLARRAKRAIESAGLSNRVIAVTRSGEAIAPGIETISCDLLDREAVSRLPDAPDVIFMAGRKFGTQGGQHMTWAANVLIPAIAAERYRESRILVFSSGNIYPFRHIAEGGATEETPTDPVGEYAQSVRARERIFEYYGTRSVFFRLNYAVELRYGVLADIGRQVLARRPVDVTTGYVNVIWQGDANSVALRSLALCSSPAAILNVTGPETLAVRDIARRFHPDARIEGTESATALLNDASKCVRLFGPPSVTPDQTIALLKHWIQSGGGSLDKPTHFESRDGKF
jgi:nucleoside-diphosphate-sugar epimerase